MRHKERWWVPGKPRVELHGQDYRRAPCLWRNLEPSPTGLDLPGTPPGQLLYCCRC